MRRISMVTRDELVAVVAERYARSTRQERGRIPDEFGAMTGLHRKHAMRLLHRGMCDRHAGPRLGRKRSAQSCADLAATPLGRSERGQNT
jgi:hypothetical protein